MPQKNNFTFYRDRPIGSADNRELQPSLIYLEGHDIICSGFVQKVSKPMQESYYVLTHAIDTLFRIDKKDATRYIQQHDDIGLVIVPKNLYNWIKKEVKSQIAAGALRSYDEDIDLYDSFDSSDNEPEESTEEIDIYKGISQTLH